VLLENLIYHYRQFSASTIQDIQQRRPNVLAYVHFLLWYLRLSLTRYLHGFLTWELFYRPSDRDLCADFFLALGLLFLLF